MDHNDHYTTLFRKLAEKTENGKLAWEETAIEGIFIAAVVGQMVFRLELCTGKYGFKHVCLEILNEVGESLGKTISVTSVAMRAYCSAAGCKQRQYEKVDRAIVLLESL